MEMETRKIKYSGLKTTLIFWSNMFSDAWGAVSPEDSLLFRDSWLTSCTCNLISHWNLQELVPMMQWRAPQLLQTQSYLVDLIASLLLRSFLPVLLVRVGHLWRSVGMQGLAAKRFHVKAQERDHRRSNQWAVDFAVKQVSDSLTLIIIIIT
jgi:hypothetical protein